MKFVKNLIWLWLVVLLAGCDAPTQEASSDIGSEEGEIPRPSAVQKIKKVFSADMVLITNGMRMSDVVEMIGEPKGVVTDGSVKLMVYDGANLEVVDGCVVNLNPDFQANVRMARERMEQTDKFANKQRAKGLVLFNGKWMKPEEKKSFVSRQLARMRKKKQEQEALPQNNQEFVFQDNAGRVIDHSPLLQKGKGMILIFYGNWSVACENLIPQLSKLVHNDKDIVFKKVDIRQWGSSIAKKYYVTSVPNIRVFDKNGQLMGLPVRSLSEAQRYVEMVRKQ